MRLCLVVVWLLANLVSAFAQSGYYQFSIDQDQLSGAPDFSHLNRPLTAEDRLFVRDGHFFRVGKDLRPNTADDEPVRLFGINIAFSGNLPYTPADAAKIAKRLRRLGVNLARLTLMDYNPDTAGKNLGSILSSGPFPTFDDQWEIRRLRDFLSALKSEGIYANLGVHVGYQFRPNDYASYFNGAPPGYDDIPGLPDRKEMPFQGKPLHIFYPKMVEVQQQFAEKLIELLGLKEGSELSPMLAMVELDNESSLLDAWQRGDLDRFVQGAYLTELQRQWNEFLQAKYRTTEALRAAWGQPVPAGAELLNASGQPYGAAAGWQEEIHWPARAGGELITLDGRPTLRVQVQQGGGQAIVKQTGFSIDLSQLYKAEIELRADGLADGATRQVVVSVMQDVNPWKSLIWQLLPVENKWKTFTIAFQPPFEMEKTGRFMLELQQAAGLTVYARGWSLRPAPLGSLAVDEKLEDKNVALPSSGEGATKQRLEDYLLFLADCHKQFLGKLKEAVRKQVGSLTPITGTQMGYGGLLTLDSHDEMDYHDDHFYVDYHQNGDWNPNDWFIHDTSHVSAGLREMINSALGREAGRPFTISEYNQPWPNTYGAEINPTVAAFAAFQGWDSVMYFAYSHSRLFYAQDKYPNIPWEGNVPGGFGLDPSRFANFGQAAWLFRTGAIRPGDFPVRIPVSRQQRLQATKERRNGAFSDFFQKGLGLTPQLALLHPVQIARDEYNQVPDAAKRPLVSPYISDTGQTSYIDEPNAAVPELSRKLFLIHAEKAAGVFGFTGWEKATAGTMDVEMSDWSGSFAAILLTSRDDQPIEQSKRMLLSVPGFTLRTQPGTRPQRTQNLVAHGGYGSGRWSLEPGPTVFARESAPGSNRQSFSNQPFGNLNFGIGPTWMERIEAVVTIRTSASKLIVHPLDGKGGRMTPLGANDVQKIAGGFRIYLQSDEQKLTPWYEIVTEMEPPTVSPINNCSAASFQCPNLARDSTVAAFKDGVAATNVGATTNPLPTELAGTKVQVLDSRGVARLAQLFFVTTDQVRYLLPAETALGEATISVTSGDGKLFAGKAIVTNVTPGLFAANDAGTGLADGYVCRVNSRGARTCEAIYDRNPQPYQITPRAIDLGVPADKVYLTLFGTGFRYRSSLPSVKLMVGGVTLPATEALADSHPGRDKVTVLLPRSLAGRGLVDVVLEVEGQRSNTLQIQIK